MRSAGLALCVLFVGGCWDDSGKPATLERLGKELYFDKNLSTPAGQACAACHEPAAGFADPNRTLPVSQGVHKDRFGNRNSPSSAYAAFSPPFQFDAKEGVYFGGQFWDGRAKDLVEQAKGPFLNALEMANPDKAAVVSSVRKAEYASAFRAVFGEDSLDVVDQAYELIAQAIAAFEKSSEVNKFSSKYDLHLAGKASLTDQEKRGLALYESDQKGKCAACHPSKPTTENPKPLFTDFTYDNLGVPRNPQNPFYNLPREFNPDGAAFVDLGLGGVLKNSQHNGKMKVPTLRNIALTGPYMHNGVFRTLREVVEFYSTRDTDTKWGKPEVAENVNTDELGKLGLTSAEIDDIVAFLNTLTDGYQLPTR